MGRRRNYTDLGQGVSQERARGPPEQAAGAFPSFNPLAIRDGEPVTLGDIPHGDGGFTDNSA